VTNDVSAAGGSSIAASSGSDGAQTVGASATTVTPPAAALNLAMQVGDCLLSAGMSANDVVVAMLGRSADWRSREGIRSHRGGSPPIPAVGGDDRERRRQRRGVTAVHHVVEDHPGHILHRAHCGPVARGTGALARAPVLPAICRGGIHHSDRCGHNRGNGSRRRLLCWRRPDARRRGRHCHARRGYDHRRCGAGRHRRVLPDRISRLRDVVMRTAGIVVGIVASLELAWRLGAPLSISPEPVALGPLGAQFVGATLISAFFALWAYADLATIGLAGAMGLLGWAGYASMIYIGSTEVPANTLGAFVAALASTLLIRRTTIPSFGLVSAALLPLVPGLSLYYGLLQVVGTSPETANPSEGGSTLLVALGVALGIAAGATLGTYLGRPIADQLRHIPARPRRRRPSVAVHRL